MRLSQEHLAMETPKSFKVLQDKVNPSFFKNVASSGTKVFASNSSSKTHNTTPTHTHTHTKVSIYKIRKKHFYIYGIACFYQD